MEAFGGKGFFVEDPKNLKGALDEAMNFRGPALVNVVISQGAARKPQQFSAGTADRLTPLATGPRHHWRGPFCRKLRGSAIAFSNFLREDISWPHFRANARGSPTRSINTIYRMTRHTQKVSFGRWQSTSLRRQATALPSNR
jgi:hypothetical protein